MIIILFLIGFILGLLYSLIGERLPLKIPEVRPKDDNSWILNLFIGIINGLLVLISHYSYGVSYEFFISIIIMALVTTIFVSDFKYLIILDSPLVISSILTLILKYCYFGLKEVGISIISGIILFVIMLLIGKIGKILFKKEALGGGDIKLAIVIGLILNLRLGLVAIILSSLLAMPYALGSIMLSKNKEVPYGPFLIGSLGIVFIFIEKFTNLINFLI